MKHLIYVGKFLPWNDKHEDALFDALEIFDKVIIAVSSKKKMKGQPSKILDSSIKHRVKIVYFNKLKDVLNHFESYKYVMFERR